MKKVFTLLAVLLAFVLVIGVCYSTSLFVKSLVNEETNSNTNTQANPDTIVTEPVSNSTDAPTTQPVLPDNPNTPDEPELISFKIENKTYEAVCGMTWEEWVNSKYNTSGYFIYWNTVDGRIDYDISVIQSPKDDSCAVMSGAVYARPNTTIVSSEEYFLGSW